MKTIQLLSLAAIICCLTMQNSYSQLSDRINNPSTLKIGTRPVAGNLGISFGVSVNDLQNIVDDWQSDSIEYQTLPITTFKYYFMDDLVFTLGIKHKRKKLLIEGDMDPERPFNILDYTYRKRKEVNTEFMLAPGVEKHFLPTNIFDVYVGARVPFGIVNDVLENDVEIDGGDYSYQLQKKNSLYYGLDILIGMQFFIADLPMALGFELEWSGAGYKSNKTKHIDETKSGNTTTTNTYYTTDLETIGYEYTSLNARSFESNTDIRISFNYFFRK